DGYKLWTKIVRKTLDRELKEQAKP
ncbi:MAG: hypothetical protein ACI9MB_001616, partial [Verrucomicrobiales bacterium]